MNKIKRHYPLIALTAVNFFFYADRYVLYILVEPIKQEFSLSDGEMGLLTGLAFAITYCLFSIPLGRLADRSGRVKIIAIAAVAWSVSTAMFSFTKNYIQMILLRASVAIGEAGGYVSIQSLIADLYKPEKRTKAMAIVYGGGSLGMIFAYSAAGAISGAYGWRSAFLFLGILGLVFGPLFYYTVKEPLRGATEGLAIEPAQSRTTLWLSLRQLGQRKSFVWIIFGYMAASVATFAVMTWLPTYLLRRFELSLAMTGLLSSVGSVGPMLMGMVVAGVISDKLYRRDPKWVIWLPAFGLAAAAVFLLLQVSTASLAVAVVAGAIPAFISGVYIPSLMAAMQSIAGARLRGTAAAISALAAMLMGQGGGPVLVGVLSDYFSAANGGEGYAPLQYALASVSVLYVVAGGFLWLAARYFLKDTKTARQFDESAHDSSAVKGACSDASAV